MRTMRIILEIESTLLSNSILMHPCISIEIGEGTSSFIHHLMMFDDESVFDETPCLKGLIGDRSSRAMSDLVVQ